MKVLRTRFPLHAWVIMLAVLTSSAFGAESGRPCHSLTYESNNYIVCQFDLRHYKPRLFWKQPDGVPYGSLQKIPRRDDSNGGPLVFATNGGMYQSDHSPLGLYVENGRELVTANTAIAAGNFYIRPNGIFYISGDNAAVVDTRHFLRTRPHADLATQSGPMLVIKGVINPRFLPNSNSRKIRNGVGVQDGHHIVFAISNGAVTFRDFARLFRNSLHCSNALYLDGSISSIYARSVERADYFMPLGPIIGIYIRGQ